MELYQSQKSSEQSKRGAHFLEIDAMARSQRGRAMLTRWQLRCFEARQPAECEPAPPVRTRARPMTVQDLFEVRP